MRSLTFLVVIVVLLEVNCLKTKRYKCFDATKHRNWRLVDQGTPCGRSADLVSRIMGGDEAALGEFPWMARVFFKNGDGEPSGGCGGSIISNRYILTAAHCCYGALDTQLAFVRIGEYDNGTSEDCYKGHCAPPHQDLEIVDIIAHEEYFAKDTANDICLLSTEKRIEFSDYVSPVCLPTPCEVQEVDFTGKSLTVAGWGVMDDTYRELDILQKVNVTGVNEKTCAKEYFGLPVSSSQICAGRIVGQDACGGDSGGPLMYKSAVGGPSRSFAVGLVSFGPACSRKDTEINPGVYTRVSSYLEWILDNIREF